MANDNSSPSSDAGSRKDWSTYDDFSGPELDPDLWQPLDIGSGPLLEPEARTSVADGVLTVDIPRFTNADPSNQLVDNSKHLVLTTQEFRIPDHGVGRFSADLRAEKVGDGSGDYRQGLVSFIAVDTTGGTNTVLAVLSTGERYFAEHEVLPVPGEHNPFTRVIEDPFFFARSKPASDSGFRHCEIEIDRSRERIVWRIDGAVLEEASALTALPEQVNMAFGVFTLMPIGEGDGSAHGQGARASWRNFAYQLVPPESQ